MDVVISCFEKDVAGMAAEMERAHPGRKVRAYHKCREGEAYNVPVNKGNEASAYLKYIVDFYHELPEKVFFCHDEEYSWHHQGSLVDRLAEAVDSETGYYNVNNYVLGSIVTNPWYDKILAWWAENCEAHVPGMRGFPKDWTAGHRGCAQFLVSRDRITRYPREFYERLYDWITTTDLPNEECGRYMEWTWHVFWGDAPIPRDAVGAARPTNLIL